MVKKISVKEVEEAINIARKKHGYDYIIKEFCEILLPIIVRKANPNWFKGEGI